MFEARVRAKAKVRVRVRVRVRVIEQRHLGRHRESPSGGTATNAPDPPRPYARETSQGHPRL